LIATRPLVVRAVTLNPNYPAGKELRALLLRLAKGDPEYKRLKESRELVCANAQRRYDSTANAYSSHD
jgi:hypothetical protein